VNDTYFSEFWLSVVTVVRDDPTGFQSTIATFLEQDREGVEFIVIDSSRDAESIPKILEKSPHLNAECIWVQPRGIYPAMNVGLERARGKYVFFANAGDSFFSQDVLGEVHQLVTEFGPVWVVGRVAILSSRGSQVITEPFDFDRERPHLFARGKFPPHQGTVVRVDTLKALGGFSCDYSIAADYHMALRLGEVARPLVSDLVLMTFYEGGVSTLKWKKSFREFHRARQDVYSPRGVARWVEIFDTNWHYFRVWIYRNVLSQPLSRKKS